jgi:hypothetical protein
MTADEYRIGDKVNLASGRHDKLGVVCSIVNKDFTHGPKEYRVAWDCIPPCPPELDPVGVWCRKYRADELTRAKAKGAA